MEGTSNVISLESRQPPRPHGRVDMSVVGDRASSLEEKTAAYQARVAALENRLGAALTLRWRGTTTVDGPRLGRDCARSPRPIIQRSHARLISGGFFQRRGAIADDAHVNRPCVAVRLAAFQRYHVAGALHFFGVLIDLGGLVADRPPRH